jgi:hypothetical protein
MNGTNAARTLKPRRTTLRVLTGVLAVPAALTLLAGCGPFGRNDTITVHASAGPADVGSSPSGAASTGSGDGTSTGGSPVRTTGPTSGSGSGSPATGKGCPAGGTAIPAGAGRARTTDLDGDGKADTVWLADAGTRRTLGVRTASGAGFSRAFQSAAPQGAGAIANTLADGSAIILLNTGRSAQLYTVTGCAIVPSLNAQGQQYTFDEGFTGYGTGVGCPDNGAGRQLVGYQAKPNTAGTSFTVSRTTISLSSGGRKASNGSTVVLGTGLPSSSATVKLAQDVSCGSAPAALEPQP